MRARQLLHHNGYISEITRHLQRFIEAQDRLRSYRRAQGRNVAAARTALQSVDARPLADVVAVGCAAIEKLLLEPRHDRAGGGILLPVGMGGGEFDIESGLLKQFFLDAHNHWKVEDLVVGSNP